MRVMAPIHYIRRLLAAQTHPLTNTSSLIPCCEQRYFFNIFCMEVRFEQTHPLTNTSSFKSYRDAQRYFSIFTVYGSWNRSNALMILAQILCNISFKLGGCIFRFFFISHFSHCTAHDSWIISQAGKWANRHFVIFFLIERPHLSSKSTFLTLYLMQRLFRTGLQQHHGCPVLSHATCFRTETQRCT